MSENPISKWMFLAGKIWWKMSSGSKQYVFFNIWLDKGEAFACDAVYLVAFDVVFLVACDVHPPAPNPKR